ALKVAASLFNLWDQRPERLQDEEWDQAVAVMEAGRDLWMVWSLKEWAQEMPYYKFFSVAMVPGWQSVTLNDINMGNTQEMPLFEEDNKDFETLLVQNPWASSKSLGKRKAGAILGRVSMDSGPSNDKDLIDEGLEGEIAVWVQWSMRATVRLAPHSKWLEFWEAEGPCQQCTTAKVAKHCWYPQARLPCCRCLNSGIACKNSVGNTTHNAQRRACVVRRREKKAAALAVWVARAPANNEGPVAGPSNTTSAALPTLGAEGGEEEILGAGILGEPKLKERDDGVLVAPEGSEGPGESESAKSVWRPTDKPVTKFKQVTCRVGELQEMEASMADYTAACKRECADLRFAFLHMQTALGETRRLKGVLLESFVDT
ncbi:hypothetical protein C0991_002143, partial [Blastosporella zonata]